MNGQAKFARILVVTGLLAALMGYAFGCLFQPLVSKSAPEEPMARLVHPAKPAYIEIGGQRIPVYPGANVEIEIADRSKSSSSSSKVGQKGLAEGASMTAFNADGLAGFQTGAPELKNIDGASGKVSGASWSFKPLDISHGTSLITIAGILCIIGGAIVAAKWNVKTGLYVAGAGVGLVLVGILFANYPWVALALPVIGLGLLGYWWWSSRKGANKQLTLETIVKAANSLPDEAFKAFKAAVKAMNERDGSAQDTVSAEVRAVKEDNALPLRKDV